MTGPDVSDWQAFLQRRRLLPSNPDGAFGPHTDTATRAYQSQKGLAADGVVVQGLLDKAVPDGYTSSTGATIWDMDSDANCLALANGLSSAGIRFAARYYSVEPSKNLTPAEAQALSAAGIQIVAVFEDSDDPAAISAAAGTAHAAKALELAQAIRQPGGSAIYFAVDFDVESSSVLNGSILPYFRAVKDRLSAAPAQYAIGVYGSGLTCRAVRDAGLAQFAWLAQSTGYGGFRQLLTEADIVQVAPERKILGGQLEIDDDIAQKSGFGAFTLT